ncbi:beta-ketoacyl synthase N-terminal-like domain-containing protein, partial [Klebsiella pneumoniae]|uniref:beta-ketoacyl synthase N-terminal-like domain-containing protein n=1 Tax=Klebsiella pneumoniae TaxID=573 RepID=UPI0039705869
MRSRNRWPGTWRRPEGEMTMPTMEDIDHVVISGMAVEAPGGIDGPGAYWAALADAREMIGPFPRDRGWPIEEML